MLRDHGQAKKYYHDVEGYNGRLDAIQAGLLQVKLAHLAKWTAERRERAEEYDRLLAANEFVTRPYEPSWSRAVYHLYVVRTHDRDGLMSYLRKRYWDRDPLSRAAALQKAYTNLGYVPGDFPVAVRSRWRSFRFRCSRSYKQNNSRAWLTRYWHSLPNWLGKSCTPNPYCKKPRRWRSRFEVFAVEREFMRREPVAVMGPGGDPGLASTTTSISSGAPATEQPTFAMLSQRGTRLVGKRAGMVVFSSYPADPRPRRAAEALLAEGMQIDLICEADDRLPQREVRDGLAITRIPIRHSRGGTLSYAYQYVSFILISAAIFAWRSLRRRYDLIYVHNMPDILVVAALIPKMLGARVILDQHDPMPELMTTIFGLNESSLAVRVIRWLEKWSLARADRVVTVSITFKRLFTGRGCPNDKIEIVMNTPDDRIFPYREANSNPRRLPGKPFVVMYHGSLVERNGVELAIDALALLQSTMPETRLYIYGRSTPYLEQMMEKVRTLGLTDSVRYLGGKTLEELVHEIESCDLGVIPNPRNAFTEINTPTRIFEYLTMGKPVVAPRTSGIQDYFGAQSLLFFEPGNADDLARMIAYAAEHPEETIACTARGQQAFQAHNWQQERETLICLVASLLAAKPAYR